MIKTRPSDHSNCGLFAVLRKAGAPKVRREQVLAGICKVKHRGSPWGSGFAVFHAPEHDLGRFKAKLLVEDERALDEVKIQLEHRGIPLVEVGAFQKTEPTYYLWEALLTASRETMLRAAREIHWQMHEGPRIRARFISLGRYSEVWKGLGWPDELAARYELAKEGDLWLAHLRQPTNWLGDSVRNHPFHELDIGLIHNGEDMADGSHTIFLASHGQRSFVGPDSEKMMLAASYLVHEGGLTMEKAMAVLSPPPERYWDKVVFQDKSSNLRQLIYRFRGLQFDGSYAILAGYTDGNDVFAAGAVAFRPLVMGEDNHHIYWASEPSQIKEVSPDASTWRCRPQRRILASMRQGIIRDGRGGDREYFFMAPSPPIPTNGTAIDIHGKSPREVVLAVAEARRLDPEVTLKGVNGARYLGMALPPETKLTIVGLGGDCIGNLTGPGRTIHVVGDLQDDAMDASQADLVAHGNLGEVPLYAYQGRRALIRGSGGNQSMVLMRGLPGEEPLVVWGNRLDDSAGEFMANGTAVVLGLDALNTRYDGSLVGDFTMSGAVGGARLYVRGKVPYQSIGLLPDPQEVAGELEQAVMDGILDKSTLERALGKTGLTWWELRRILPPKSLERIAPLFHHRYLKPLEVEHRPLHPNADEDARAVEGIQAFGGQFPIAPEVIARLLAAKYTVIYPVKSDRPK